MGRPLCLSCLSALVDVDEDGAADGGVEPHSDDRLVLWRVIKLVGLPNTLKFHNYDSGGVPAPVSGANLGAIENQLAAVLGQCRDRRSLVGAKAVRVSDLLNLADDVSWHVLS